MFNLSILISKLTTDEAIMSTAACLCLYSLPDVQSESETDTVWARLSGGVG